MATVEDALPWMAVTVCHFDGFWGFKSTIFAFGFEFGFLKLDLKKRMRKGQV